MKKLTNLDASNLNNIPNSLIPIEQQWRPSRMQPLQNNFTSKTYLNYGEQYVNQYQKRGNPFTGLVPRSVQENLLFNYDDPTEINSIADVILTTANPNMKHSKMFGDNWSKIPGLNIISDTLDLGYRQVKPLFKGEYLTAGLNTLVNLGETLDVLASPIKAIAQGNGWDGVVSATVGNEQGRKNYDWNTGIGPSIGPVNLADLGLEIISDPLNWISFGGKAVLSTSIKTALKEGTGEVVEALSRKTARTAVKDEATRMIAKAAKRSILSGDVAEEASQAIARNINRLAKSSKTGFRIADDITQDAVQLAAKKLHTVAVESMNSTVLKGIYGTMVASNTFEKTLLKSVLYTTGAYPLLKATVGNHMLRQALENRFLRKVEQNTITAASGIDKVNPAYKFTSVEQLVTDASDLFTSTPELMEAWGSGDRVKHLMGMATEYQTTAMKSIIADTTIDYTTKLDQINNLVRSYVRDGSVNNISDYITKVESLNALIKNTDIQYSKLDDVLIELSDMKNILSDMDNVIRLQEFKVAPNILAKTIGVSDEYIRLNEIYTQAEKRLADYSARVNMSSAKTQKVINYIMDYIKNTPEYNITKEIPKKNIHEFIREVDTLTPQEVTSIRKVIGEKDIAVLTQVNQLYDMIKHTELDSNGLPKYGYNNIKALKEGIKVQLSSVVRSNWSNLSKDKLALKKLYDYVDSINLDKMEQVIIDMQDLNTYSVFKMEIASMVNKLNNNPAFIKSFADDNIAPIFDNILNVNNPEYAQFYAQFDDTTLDIIKTMKVTADSIKVYNRFIKEVTANGYFDDPKIASALIGSLQSQGRRSIDNIEQMQQIVFNITDSIESYTATSSTNFKSMKLDNLIEKYNLKLPEGLNRHTAEGDNVMTILAMEADEGKAYTGWVLDTETTGLDKRTGIFTEITMSRRTPGSNEFEHLRYKLSIPEQELRENLPDINTLKVFYPDVADDELVNRFIKDYASEYNNNNIVREIDMLNSLSESLNKIPEYTTIRTFNGNKFDLPYINYRAAVANMSLDNGSKLNIKDLFNKLNTEDYLRILREKTGTYKYLSEADTRKIHYSLMHYFNNMIDISKNTLDKTTLVNGINENSMNKIFDMFDLDYIKQTIENSPLYYNDIKPIYDDTWHILTGYVDNNLTNSLLLKFLNNESVDNLKLFKVNIENKQLRESLYNIYKEYLTDLLDIDNTNEILGRLPVSSKLLEDTNFINGLKEVLKSGIRNPDMLRRIDNMKISNWSQVLYGISDNVPIVGYTNIKGNIKNVLDLEGVNEMLFTDLRAANDFYMDINRRYASILNNSPLIPLENAITRLLLDLKDERLFKKLTWINPTLPDVRSKYAMLESVFNTMKNYGKNNDIVWGSAMYRNVEKIDKIITTIQKKYPQLYSLLEDNTILKQKLSIDSDSLYLKKVTGSFIQTPETVNEAYNLARAQSDNAEDLFRILSSNSDLPDIPPNIELQTVGSYQVKLNKYYLDTFVDGKPTAKTLIFNEVSHTLTDVFSQYNTNMVLKLNNEDLFRYLVTRTGDRHFFTMKQITKDGFFQNKQTYLDFIARKKDLQKLGIELDIDEASNRLFVYLNDDTVKNIKINKNPATKLITPYLYNNEPLETLILEDLNIDILKGFFKTEDSEVIDLFMNVRNKINEWQPELGGVLGITHFDKTYDEALEVLPDKYRNMFKDRVINKFNPYFNGWSLGDTESIKEYFPRMNTSYQENLNLLSNKILNHSDKHREYTQFVMQSGVGLDNPLIKDMSAKELNNLLSTHRDYIMVYLSDSPKYKFGYTLNAVDYITDKNLIEAKRLNAKIIPYEIYQSGVENINKFNYNNNVFATWHRVVQLYKSGFLNSFGMLIRNIFDSNIKNIIETGDIKETSMNTIRAMDMLHRYDTVMKEIQALDPYKRYRLDNAAKYFDTVGRKLSKEDYDFVYEFMNRNGNVGLVSENKLIASFIRKPNAYVEDVVRLSQYLDMYDKGFARSEIYRRISEVQFNYKIKSRGENIMELFMPFYSFFSKSIVYFMDLVETRPEVFRQLTNVYTPIWNFDDQDYYELSHNRSLQYQLVSGNIPIDDKGTTFKLGLSILDMLNFMSSPLDNITGRLLPPIQTTYNKLSESNVSKVGNGSAGVYDTNVSTSNDDSLVNTVLTNMPFGSVYQRYAILGPKYYDRTGNEATKYIPDILGATKRYAEYTPKTKNIKRYRKYNNNYNKYSKKYYSKRYFAKRVYPNYYHRISKVNNWMWDLYTKRGKPRTNIFNMSGKSLTKYKMREMWQYRRYQKYRP